MSAMILIYANKKSALSSSVGRHIKPAITCLHQAGDVFRFDSTRRTVHGGSHRVFPSTVSSHVSKFANSVDLAHKALSYSMSYRNCESKHYGSAATTTTIVRAPPGNPTTMAFMSRSSSNSSRPLGIRTKSSGSASFLRQSEENEEKYDAYCPSGTGDGSSNGIAAGAEWMGRSHYESWMANLGRGDEAWLSRPRSQDWYTGLQPGNCPGKCTIIRKGSIICLTKFVSHVFQIHD